jgi:hypothetical protein
VNSPLANHLDIRQLVGQRRSGDVLAMNGPAPSTKPLAGGRDGHGSGALGFKGDSAQWVADDSPHAGTETRMQEAADLADSGGTVTVLAGT